MVIRALFLDVGDTLVYPHPSSSEVIAESCRAGGIQVTAEQVATAERAIGPRVRQRLAQGPLYSISAESSERFWTWVYDQLLSELRVPEARRLALAQTFHRRFNTVETWRLYPEALPALEAIHARREQRGLVCGVLSNWEDWLEALLTHLDIDRYFDFLVISSTEQVEKPAPAIFQRALERAGTRPEEAMHVGDSLQADVQGAQRAGIRAVLLDRRGSYTPEQVPGATIIRSLEAFPALLD